jgi:hypothetical protein
LGALLFVIALSYKSHTVTTNLNKFGEFVMRFMNQARNEYRSQTKRFASFILVLATLTLSCAPQATLAADTHNTLATQHNRFAVVQNLGAPPEGVTDLRFRDFIRMPVGPKGLEPSVRLLSLDGKRVRLVGYMAHQEQPTANQFILAHLPVSMSEDEDGLADDLPPNVVFVHMKRTSAIPLKHLSGLLQFQGTLSVGLQEEPDGRVSNVRLLLDGVDSEALASAAHLTHLTSRASQASQ